MLHALNYLECNSTPSPHLVTVNMQMSPASTHSLRDPLVNDQIMINNVQ